MNRTSIDCGTSHRTSLETPPDAPTLITPEDNLHTNNDVIDLDWMDVEDAAEYTLLVDNDPNFSSPVTDAILTSTTFTIPALTDESYYWKVMSRDLAGNENSSTTRIFTVDTQPPKNSIYHHQVMTHASTIIPHSCNGRTQ